MRCRCLSSSRELAKPRAANPSAQTPSDWIAVLQVGTGTRDEAVARPITGAAASFPARLPPNYSSGAEATPRSECVVPTICRRCGARVLNRKVHKLGWFWPSEHFQTFYKEIPAPCTAPCKEKLEDPSTRMPSVRAILNLKFQSYVSEV